MVLHLLRTGTRKQQKEASDLRIVQYDLLTIFIRSHMQRRTVVAGNVGCTPTLHVLTCDHYFAYPDGRATFCTLACRDSQHENLVTNRQVEELEPIPVHSEGLRPSIAQDTEFEGEDYPVCPDCYLREVLVRFYHFVQDAKVGDGVGKFDTKTFVENYVPVAIFPEIVEISSKVDGKVFAWAGPEIIPLWWFNDQRDFDLIGFIGRWLINDEEGSEIPMAEVSAGPCDVQVLPSAYNMAAELILVPAKLNRCKKTVTFKNTVDIREIPARGDPVTLFEGKPPRPKLPRFLLERQQEEVAVEVVDSLTHTQESESECPATPTLAGKPFRGHRRSNAISLDF